MIGCIDARSGGDQKKAAGLFVNDNGGFGVGVRIKRKGVDTDGGMCIMSE